MPEDLRFEKPLILRFILPAIPSFHGPALTVSAADRSNIVFVFSDDHATQAISAYGGRLAGVAPAPNLDRIAEEGVLFKRCMVTNSICGPSRAA